MHFFSKSVIAVWRKPAVCHHTEELGTTVLYQFYCETSKGNTDIHSTSDET